MSNRDDYFLKFDGIPGESKDEKHKDEIDVLSWGWSQRNSGSHSGGGGGGVGHVDMEDFHVAMEINKSTPQVFLHCATGKPIKEALLTCRKAGGKQEEFLKFKFTHVVISSHNTTGAGGGTKPVDNITLNFSKLEVTYAEQSDSGPVGSPETHWYDLKTKKGQ